MLHSLYCQKFIGVDLEQDIANDKENKGIYGLI